MSQLLDDAPGRKMGFPRFHVIHYFTRLYFIIEITSDKSISRAGSRPHKIAFPGQEVLLLTINRT